MANTPKSEDTTSGVKSYDVPERKTAPVGRIVTIVVTAIIVIFLLTRFF